MQRSLLRLAVGLLTFGIGVSATMFWIAYRTPHAKKFKTTSCQMRPLLPLPPPPPMVEELPPPPPRFDRAPISGGLLDGKALSKPAPVYPRAAVASNASGMVRVEVLVNENGKVEMVSPPLSGNPLLQEAAVKAAFQARFAPTRLEGQPVKVSGTLTYNFVLP